MPNPNAPGQQKHQLHDALEAHITEWAGNFGITFAKHELDEALRIGHVRGSLDQAQRGEQDLTRLKQALALTGGFADFMASQGASDPLVGRTVAAMQGLLT